MRSGRLSTFGLLGPVLALLPLPGAAQDETQLEDIIVSGGFAPIVANGYGGSYSVVTSEDMDQRGIATVQDALRALPGVSVSSTGSTFTQVRIRGAEANHTLILIDGVEAQGGSGEYVLSGLETANVEKIEVLRGPQSVYFGSNASAGVVNIITRKASEPGLHYGGTVEAGNGAAGSFYLTMRGASGGLSLTGSSRNDLGYDQSGDGGEKDGTRRTTLGISGDWQATPDLSFGFTARRAIEDYDYDIDSYTATDAAGYVVDDPAQHSEVHEVSASVFADYRMMEGRLTHHLEFQDTVTDQSSDGGPWTTGRTQKLKYRLSAALDGKPADQAGQLVNLMIEGQHDTSTEAPDYSRRMTSTALEYRGFFANGLDVQLGLRHDDNDVFRDFTSWNAGLSWRVPDSPFRLHASAGRGEVNPSYYELFADDSYTQGNPNLKPEINSGYDIGVETSFPGDKGSIDLTYFNERMEDEITYAYGAAPDGSGRASYVNQAGISPRHGIELAAHYQPRPDIALTASYTWLHASNPDGSVEIRRPRQELGLSATKTFLAGRGSVTLDLRHVEGNYDTQFWGSYATVELPAYTTVDLAAGYDLTDHLRATARISNLFNADYADVWGYASPGRTVHAGIEAKW